MHLIVYNFGLLVYYIIIINQPQRTMKNNHHIANIINDFFSFAKENKNETKNVLSFNVKDIVTKRVIGVKSFKINEMKKISNILCFMDGENLVDLIPTCIYWSCDSDKRNFGIRFEFKKNAKKVFVDFINGTKELTIENLYKANIIDRIVGYENEVNRGNPKFDFDLFCTKNGISDARFREYKNGWQFPDWLKELDKDDFENEIKNLNKMVDKVFESLIKFILKIKNNVEI